MERLARQKLLIKREIANRDRLLIVLSRDSLHSEWVKTEICIAANLEKRQETRKLFPIRLIDMQPIKEWKFFDADSGRDLAKEVRKYLIPDFSDWKNHDLFKAEFEGLLRDLKAEELASSV